MTEEYKDGIKLPWQSISILIAFIAQSLIFLYSSYNIVAENNKAHEIMMGRIATLESRGSPGTKESLAEIKSEIGQLRHDVDRMDIKLDTLHDKIKTR